MVTYAGKSMDNVDQWRCISTDIVTVGNQILTNDSYSNEKFKNGDEIVLMDTTQIYLYDEENKTLALFA